MDPKLRIELTRILPRPVTRPVGGQPFRGAVSTPTTAATAATEDYLLAVDRTHAAHAGEPGFDLHEAQSAAEQLNRALGRTALRPGLFALDPGRVRRLLS